jgi:hypothetical protein
MRFGPIPIPYLIYPGGCKTTDNGLILVMRIVCFGPEKNTCQAWMFWLLAAVPIKQL